MRHWRCGEDEVMESVAGMGGNGSKGVLTTIVGVVRIPGVGGFTGGMTEEEGIGIWRLGFGGLARPEVGLEGVCD
jgi:hypothetical protein